MIDTFLRMCACENAVPHRIPDGQRIRPDLEADESDNGTTRWTDEEKEVERTRREILSKTGSFTPDVNTGPYNNNPGDADFVLI